MARRSRWRSVGVTALNERGGLLMERKRLLTDDIGAAKNLCQNLAIDVRFVEAVESSEVSDSENSKNVNASPSTVSHSIERPRQL